MGGWARRRGWRHQFYATGQPYWARSAAVPPEPEPELNSLKLEADRLREELEAIHQRIAELERK